MELSQQFMEEQSYLPGSSSEITEEVLTQIVRKALMKTQYIQNERFKDQLCIKISRCCSDFIIFNPFGTAVAKSLIHVLNDQKVFYNFRQDKLQQNIIEGKISENIKKNLSSFLELPQNQLKFIKSYLRYRKSSYESSQIIRKYFPIQPETNKQNVNLFKQLLASFLEICQYESNNYLNQGMDQQTPFRLRPNRHQDLCKNMLSVNTCLNILTETLLGVNSQGDTYERLLIQRRNLIESFRQYSEQYILANNLCKPRPFQLGKDSSSIFEFLNHLMILKALEQRKLNKVMKYTLLKQIEDFEDDFLYNPLYTSTRGYSQTVFPFDLNGVKQLGTIIGWEGKIKLIMDMIEGLLQLQEMGVFHTDINFANKVQVGEHYRIIDFDHAYKFFSQEDTQGLKIYQKYVDIQTQCIDQEWTKDQTNKFEEYKNILFDTPFQPIQTGINKYADQIRKNIKTSFPFHIYFPKKLNAAQFMTIRNRISRKHVLQLAHQISLIVKDSDSHRMWSTKYYQKMQIINLVDEILQASNNDGINMYTMHTFRAKILSIIFKQGLTSIEEQFKNGLKMYQEAPVQVKYCCEICGPEIQINLLKITKFKIHPYCHKHKEILQQQISEGNNPIIVINLQNPFWKDQNISLDLLRLRNLNQVLFQKQTFSQDEVSWEQAQWQYQLNVIVKYSILIHIYNCLSQRQGYDRIRKTYCRFQCFINDWLAKQKDKAPTLLDLLNQYSLSFGFNDDSDDMAKIMEYYESYPVGPQKAFQQETNRMYIKKLHYNDRFLNLVHETIIRSGVKVINQEYRDYQAKIHQFRQFIEKASNNQQEYSLIKEKMSSLLRSINPQTKSNIQKLQQFEYQRHQQMQQQQINYYKKIIAIIKAYKKIRQKFSFMLRNENMSEQQQLGLFRSKINSAFDQIGLLLSNLRRQRNQDIDEMEYDQISMGQCLNYFQYDQVIFEQTSQIQSYLKMEALQPIFQKLSQKPPGSRIIAQQSKIHDLTTDINTQQSEIVFFNAKSKKREIVDIINQKQLHSLYLRGKEREKQEDEMSDQLQSDEEIAQSISPCENIDDQQDLGWNKQVQQSERMDDQIRWVVKSIRQRNYWLQLRSLVLSCIAFSKNSCHQLGVLFSEAKQLKYFNMKKCDEFISSTLKDLSKHVQIIDFNDIGFASRSTFTGLHLDNKQKLKSLTIEQLDKNCHLNKHPQDYVDLSRLQSLEYLRLKWFLNIEHDDNYFCGINEDSLKKLKHLTIKTHTISRKIIETISKMKKLQVINLTAIIFEPTLQQILEAFEQLKNMVTFKIRLTEEHYQDKKPNKDHQAISDQQLDESDDSSQTNPGRHQSGKSRSGPQDDQNSDQPDSASNDLEYQPGMEPNNQHHNNFCRSTLSKIIQIITDQWKNIKFLRLQMPKMGSDHAQSTSLNCFLGGIRKIEINKGRLDEMTVERIIQQGIIVQQHRD